MASPVYSIRDYSTAEAPNSNFEMLFSGRFWRIPLFRNLVTFERKKMCFQLSIAIVCQNVPPQGTLPSIADHRLRQKTFFRTWKNMLIFKIVIKCAILCIFNYGWFELPYVLKCDEQKCSPCRKT